MHRPAKQEPDDDGRLGHDQRHGGDDDQPLSLPTHTGLFFPRHDRACPTALFCSDFRFTATAGETPKSLHRVIGLRVRAHQKDLRGVDFSGLGCRRPAER